MHAKKWNSSFHDIAQFLHSVAAAAKSENSILFFHSIPFLLISPQSRGYAQQNKFISIELVQ